MSKPTKSIQALAFLECYLHLHSDIGNLAKTEETLLPESEEISQAKIKIQSISILPVDNVMESECLQSFKSSLEILLSSNDQTGVQLANIKDVLGKLAVLESKYPSASGITAEVNKAFLQKLKLEQEVADYTNRFSEAKKEEPKFLNCISMQKSTIEELEIKLAEEKAILVAFEESHATHKRKTDELNYKREQAEKILCHHCSHERTRVEKALQARNDLKLVGATWVQIQQLVSLISGSERI